MDARRGFVPGDEKVFSDEGRLLLGKALKDILYLMERGYPIKNASTFVGNHYLLSDRQKLALVRASAVKSILDLRLQKQLTPDTLGKRAHIDGLNLIITLEVALSEGILIRCLDRTIRDLAGLRGTYHLIEETDKAILLIGDELTKLKVEEAVFYLDAPVSNTGRLKQRLLDLLKNYPIRVSAELVNNADVILEKQENVITTDAIILNKCSSWYNLAAEIIADRLPGASIIDLISENI